MRKHIPFCFMLILAVLLALPIYSIAQSKLILDSGGSRIGGATIQSFSMGTDGTMVFYLSSGFADRNIYPVISIANVPGDGSCTITQPATVSAIQGSTFQFQVTTDSSATLSMVVNPDEGVATFSNGIFSWNTSGTPPVAAMSYLANFQSCIGTCFGTGAEDHTSQLLVWININPPETVSTPTVSGPSTGTVNVAANFNITTASTSSLQHSVQYYIDCGNGTNSGWLPVGTTSYGCTYGSTGQFNVTAKAHCSQHSGVESATSSPASITISTAPTETITTPAVTGPTTGTMNQPYTFNITTASTSSLGHSVQYQIDCGNGTTPSWLPVGTTSQGCTYGSTGQFNVTAKARCSQDYVESAPSSASIMIGEGPTGQWTPQVNIARVIGTGTIVEGCYAAMDVTISKNGTYYFLIDPKGSGIAWLSGTLRIDIVDPQQAYNINIYYPQLIKLNANNDQIWKVNIPGSGDFGRTIPGFTREEYNQGYKFLIEIKEQGLGSQAGVDIFWQFSPF